MPKVISALRPLCELPSLDASHRKRLPAVRLIFIFVELAVSVKDIPLQPPYVCCVLYSPIWFPVCELQREILVWMLADVYLILKCLGFEETLV